MNFDPVPPGTCRHRTHTPSKSRARRGPALEQAVAHAAVFFDHG